MQYQIVCCPPSSGYIQTAALCVLKRLFSDTLKQNLTSMRVCDIRSW